VVGEHVERGAQDTATGMLAAEDGCLRHARVR
jgi:hypothetical protein